MNLNIQNLLRYGDKKPSNTYWCKKCNVPLIQGKCENCNKYGADILNNCLRPVFKDELDVIKKQSKSEAKWLTLSDLSFWTTWRNYFYNGEKIFKIKGLTGSEPLTINFFRDDKFLPKKLLEIKTIITNLKRANQSSLDKLEYQAIEFIKQAAETFQGKLPIISFSGGKDSCVVSHLVRLALGSKILHIFGDTTIEYPDTYKFIEKFKKDNPTIPFLTAKPTKDFFELAEEIGAPSRILRWCCTTHKITPISNLIASLNDEKGVLAYIGNRRTESSRRSKYNSIELKHKVANEILINPILTWSDTELWSYILTRNINFSEGYKFGFTRLGCLYCPFEKAGQSALASIKYKNEMYKWDTFLTSFAKKIGYKDIKKFKDYGWKARAGARGIEYNPTKIIKNECFEKENAYNYELPFWKENFLEYLKPFGVLSKIYDDGTIANYNVIDTQTNEPIFFIKISRPRKHLHIVIFIQKNKKLLLARIDRQIKRFQSCILCGQCQNICRVRAFGQDNEYFIDQNKCTHCLQCVKKECLATRVFKRSPEYEIK